MRFWNIIAVLLFVLTFLFVLLFLLGCNPESPDVRLTFGIKAYNVKDASYTRIALNKHGQPVRCETDFAACFVYADGSRIQSGGLRFVPTHDTAEYFVYNPSGSNYWTPTDGGGTVSTLVTGDSGFAVFTSWCTQWGVRNLQTRMLAKGKKTTETLVAFAKYENRYDSQTGELIAWYGRDSKIDLLGGHYYSGGYNQFSSVSEAEVSPGGHIASVGNLSEAEASFMDDDSLLVDSGFSVSGAVWSMQAGQPGQGYAVAVDRLTGLDHTDTSTLMYRSTPYFLSVSVALAEPVDVSIVGLSVPAQLTVGGAFASPINMTVASISADGRRMVARSDYIIPIDAQEFVAADVPEWVYDRWTEADDPNDPAINLYAPMFYMWDDPNHVVYDPNFIDHNNVIHNRLDPERFVPVVCVPVFEGQTMKIEFTQKTILPLLPYLAENWLTDYRTMDLNGDGIVNYKDWLLLPF